MHGRVDNAMMPVKGCKKTKSEITFGIISKTADRTYENFRKTDYDTKCVP
jgi:hypothetical protein